jgi:hypothetical protein
MKKKLTLLVLPFIFLVACSMSNTPTSKVDELFSKVYAESKINSCKVMPVIEVSKAKLNGEGSVTE